MKINTQGFLKDLGGADLPDLPIGKTIGNIVASQKAAVDPMKNFILGQKFYTEDAVEVDAADLSLVKECIRRSDAFPAVTGQLLLMLADKQESKPEPAV